MSLLSHLPADHVMILAGMLACSFGIGIWAVGHQITSGWEA